MLTAILNTFAARQFPGHESHKLRITKWASALIWGVITFLVYKFFVTNGAMPGENAVALADYSNAGAFVRAANPLLRMITACLPETILAFNTFAALLMGCTAAVTFMAVDFWVRDAVEIDVQVKRSATLSILTSHVSTALFLTTLTAWYAGTGFNVSLWNFLLLTICVLAQNGYALSGGRRWRMVSFGLVLGFTLFESPWVLLLLPLFFLRVVSIEWRLWDQSVKRLPLWFMSMILGIVAFVMIVLWHQATGYSLAAIWETIKGILFNFVSFYKSLFSGAWMLELLLGTGWIFISWLTARRLLNNERSWGLIFTAIVLSLMAIVEMLALRMMPMRLALSIGSLPVATAWATSVVSGMFLIGWGLQLFVRNANIFEEEDTGHMPAAVIASRAVALFLFPLLIAGLITAGVLHTWRFMSIDRTMVNRFASETITAIGAPAGQEVSPVANHPYLLSAPWLDNHLMLMAKQHNVPMKLLSPGRMYDKAYLEDLRTKLTEDPLLGDADRLRMTHLLDYNFLVFLQDFFISQSNAVEIATAYELSDVWYAAKMRPCAVGTIFTGISESEPPSFDPVPIMKALNARWAKTMESDLLPWWDFNQRAQREIRHHLTYMYNNLGTLLDDLRRYDEAAEAYAASYALDKENISALLNMYDICVRRGQLESRKGEIMHAFDEFVKASSKSVRKYDLSMVGRYYGYIRNYDLFVQMGWDWAISAAPESVLAGLRNAQNGLAPTDPRNGAVQSVLAAVYELQGQTERSKASYNAAVAADPKNVEAMRSLARLSIQSGNVNDAGQWLAKAEEAGANQDDLDLDKTAYLMAIGDLQGARTTIARYTTHYKDSAAGWAMLGMIEVEQGNLDRAGAFIMENIRRTAKGRDIYFIHILQGRIAQARGANAQKANNLEEARKYWEDARNHYRRAYAMRSNLHTILAVIMEFDRLLEDKSAAEIDGLALLRSDPTQPYANFVVGAQRLEDGHVAAAIKYFTSALNNPASPSLDLLNNAADAYARTEDPKKGLEYIMQALKEKGANERFDLWGTMAWVLVRDGQIERAKIALKKSRSLPGGDNPRLGMVDVWIAIMENQKAAAQKALDEFKNVLNLKMTPLEVKDASEAQAKIDTLK